MDLVGKWISTFNLKHQRTLPCKCCNKLLLLNCYYLIVIIQNDYTLEEDNQIQLTSYIKLMVTIELDLKKRIKIKGATNYGKYDLIILRNEYWSSLN